MPGTSRGRADGGSNRSAADGKAGPRVWGGRCRIGRCMPLLRAGQRDQSISHPCETVAFMMLASTRPHDPRRDLQGVSPHRDRRKKKRRGGASRHVRLIEPTGLNPARRQVFFPCVCIQPNVEAYRTNVELFLQPPGTIMSQLPALSLELREQAAAAL